MLGKKSSSNENKNLRAKNRQSIEQEYLSGKKSCFFPQKKSVWYAIKMNTSAIVVFFFSFCTARKWNVQIFYIMEYWKKYHLIWFALPIKCQSSHQEIFNETNHSKIICKVYTNIIISMKYEIRGSPIDITHHTKSNFIRTTHCMNFYLV